jgi:hypothetical protein
MSAIGNNAQAGPSRVVEQQATASHLQRVFTSQLSEVDVSSLLEDSGEPVAKRARIKRSSKACRSVGVLPRARR